MRGGEATHLHKGIGERVQALQFLDFALEKPVFAVSLYRSGVPIKVPSPERYALHKLFVAQMRSGSFREKRGKDLDQAEWLLAVLAERRPFETWLAWDEMRRRGRKWHRLADESLDERQSVKEALETVEEEYGPAKE